ncbi:hypothetical protein TRFO_22843 [Tritrichomonas foetus]|uniref:EamA domain-containing protein n=1 Tax=Tritrichomonas foetus TaxID=1144522 RepID=A0A1J4KGW8_9EUKA|nr:hypothetical protein TRFO_22843 [Tritrichomonas foetus]|eukprot:OHT08581.1 hypothetical protein TRFO_22843 [Tritrichomonas foetus]
MGSLFTQIIAVIILFITGSIYPVVNNYILTHQFPYKNGLTLQFRQPWLQTFFVCFGMTFFMIPTLIRAKCKANIKADKISGFNLFRVIIAPSLLTILYVALQTYCLMFMPVNIWQIFNEFYLLFNAFFSVTFRGQKLHFTDWTGLFFVVIGIAFAGVASLMRSISERSATTTELFFSFILQILAHCLKGFASLGEDYMLQNSNTVTVTGFEGLWGIYLIAFIFLPFCNITKSQYVGIHEITADAVTLFQNSTALIILEIVFICCIAFYRFCSLYLYSLSSFRKTLYESFLPITVWLISYFTHLFTKQENSRKFFDYNSYFEASGLIITLFGSFIYHRIIRLPCFAYSKETIDNNSSEVQIAAKNYLLQQEI